MMKREPAETTDKASEGDDTAQSGSKILIAYFTAAENGGADAVSLQAIPR